MIATRLFSVEPALPALPAHPRLLWTNEAVVSARRGLDEHPAMRAWFNQVRDRAETLAKEAPLTRVMEGRRLLTVSREALARLLAWGVVHRLEPDPKWVARARAELLAVCAFSDWNPAHFLDVGEMATAVAIGYDWFYEDLSEEDRAIVARALAELALKPGLKGGWWVRTDNNWNPVCHGGLSLAALAVAELYPEEARATLERARENIPRALAAYDPDGVHPESPGYWDYGTGYFVVLAMGLQSALGDDWGITQHEGLRKSFDYRVQVVGPSGDVFNYGDGNPGASPLLFHPFMALRAERSDWAAFFLEQSRESKRRHRDRFLPLPLLHWPSTAEDAPPPPLDHIGHGKVELASLRSAWNDPAARWIALRGGTIAVNHAHMDLGSFVLEACGVRWAEDLGMESAIYARKDAWGTQDGSLRWTFLRADLQSHNTLVLDGAAQKSAAHAPLRADGKGAAVIDLTSAYPGQAARITRRVALTDPGRFRVTDTLTAATLEKELRWQMVTRAGIEIAEDGRSAVLRRNEKSLRLVCHSPAGGVRFAVEKLAPQREEENPNRGYHRIVLTWPAPLPDSAVLDIELIPEYTPGGLSTLDSRGRGQAVLCSVFCFPPSLKLGRAVQVLAFLRGVVGEVDGLAFGAELGL